jgi:hypothetical protein
VPEKMLHEFRVDPAPQNEGSAGMMKVVPADRGKACLLEEWLEVTVDYVLSVLWGALARGENEPVILYVGTCSRLVIDLLLIPL